jgi:protein-tyrosine phosphatase
MVEIKDHLLWIGHAGDSRAFEQLFAAGVQAVVQVAAEELPPAMPRDLIFCHFPMLDGAGNRPEVLSLTLSTIIAFLRLQIPTLVCCGAGMSRSPALAAAALAVVHNESAGEWLERITTHHASDVSPGLWNQIIELIPSLT